MQFHISKDAYNKRGTLTFSIQSRFHHDNNCFSWLSFMCKRAINRQVGNCLQFHHKWCVRGKQLREPYKLSVCKLTVESRRTSSSSLFWIFVLGKFRRSRKPGDSVTFLMQILLWELQSVVCVLWEKWRRVLNSTDQVWFVTLLDASPWHKALLHTGKSNPLHQLRRIHNRENLAD